MVAEVVIYHNPKCSKSRQTLDLIRRCGKEPRIHEYLKEPLPATTLDSICRALGIEPLSLFRTSEKLFGELGLSSSDQRTRSEWLKILEGNPILIERPIVVFGNKVVLGRPPENVLEILN